MAPRTFVPTRRFGGNAARELEGLERALLDTDAKTRRLPFDAVRPKPGVHAAKPWEFVLATPETVVQLPDAAVLRKNGTRLQRGSMIAVKNDTETGTVSVVPQPGQTIDSSGLASVSGGRSCTLFSSDGFEWKRMLASVASGGAPSFTFVNVTTNYTALPWDFVIVDPSAPMTVTLPDPAVSPNAEIIVKMKGYRYFRTPVTLSGLIENTTTYEIGYVSGIDAIHLHSDGTAWRVANGYRSRKWIGAYKIELRQHANLTIVNGANVIDGITWTGSNVARTTEFAIVNGVGLRIKALATAGGNNDMNGATNNAPKLRTAVQNLLEFYGVTNHYVRCQTRVTLTNADSNFEGARIGIEDATSPTNQYAGVVKYFNGAGIIIQSFQQQSGTFSVSGLNTTPTDDILAVSFQPPQGWGSLSGTYDTGVDDGYLNADHPWDSYFQSMSAPLMRFNPQPTLFLCQQTANSTSTLELVFTHLQVDFHELLPFTNP